MKSRMKNKGFMMVDEQYDSAAQIWYKSDLKSNRMEREKLYGAIFEYLESHKTLALATGYASQIRNTPVDYAFHDGAFWIFSEGGEKFVGLKENKNVALTVFDDFQDWRKLRGLQANGVASVYLPGAKEYVRAAKMRGLDPEKIGGLEHPLYLIKVVPSKITFTNAEFKNDGYAMRQNYEFKEN